MRHWRKVNDRVLSETSCPGHWYRARFHLPQDVDLTRMVATMVPPIYTALNVKDTDNPGIQEWVIGIIIVFGKDHNVGVGRVRVDGICFLRTSYVVNIEHGGCYGRYMRSWRE